MILPFTVYRLPFTVGECDDEMDCCLCMCAHVSCGGLRWSAGARSARRRAGSDACADADTNSPARDTGNAGDTACGGDACAVS